jgi:hypothetical protein
MKHRILIKGSAVVIAAAVMVAAFGLSGPAPAYAQTVTTGFAPLDKNINVGEQIQLKYFASGVEPSGQWFSLTPDILESLGGGLFRGKAEGYAQVRFVPQGSSSGATEYMGVVDPSKTPNSSFDVSLVKRTPIYTWVDARYNGANHLVENLSFIPGPGGGSFAAVGECADGRRAAWGVLGFSHDVELEGGGLYVFNEGGQFIGKGDVCKDTASVRVCYEGGGCMVGHGIIPIGNGRFILDTGNGGPNSRNRSPLLYNATGGVSRENRIFFTNWNDLVDQTREREVIRFHNTAYANGIMVGIGTETTGQPPRSLPGFPGSSSLERKNIFYSVPGFQRLADVSVPTSCPSRSCSGSPSLTHEEYVPIFGSGEYFVAKKGNPLSSVSTLPVPAPPFDVYHMPSEANLRAGQLPQKVQTIDPDFQYITDIAYDALDPSRVLVVGVTSATGRSYVIYEPGPNGLEATDEGDLDTSASRHNTALMGEYIAYTSCASAPTGVIDYNPGALRTCRLVVEKNGQKLSVEPLPLPLFHGSTNLFSNPVAISPSGNILLGARSNLIGIFGEQGYIYMYRIGAGGVPPPSPPGGDPTPPGPPQSVIGQTLNVSSPTTLAPAQVLIRFANILTSGIQSLQISVFGKVFDVDASAATRIVDSNWNPTTLANIALGGFVNVWGTLDAANETLIRAMTVRSPIVGPGRLLPTSQPTSQQAPLAAPITNTAAQSSLDSLYRILLQLQSQVGQ